MQSKGQLKTSNNISIRFSEVDSMNIVWHGSYVLYFEDAREIFGKQYGLDYLTIFANGYYAPLVDMQFSFKHTLNYGDQARIDITYVPCQSAKILFEYEIWLLKGSENILAATGSTTQVFLDKEYGLVLYSPDFYTDWKKKNGVL